MYSPHQTGTTGVAGDSLSAFQQGPGYDDQRPQGYFKAAGLEYNKDFYYFARLVE
jgi:hypothetical protein